jgi:hypothetical protein
MRWVLGTERVLGGCWAGSADQRVPSGPLYSQPYPGRAQDPLAAPRQLHAVAVHRHLDARCSIIVLKSGARVRLERAVLCLSVQFFAWLEVALGPSRSSYTYAQRCVLSGSRTWSTIIAEFHVPK